jgi:hypothetical protein
VSSDEYYGVVVKVMDEVEGDWSCWRWSKSVSRECWLAVAESAGAMFTRMTELGYIFLWEIQM